MGYKIMMKLFPGFKSAYFCTKVRDNLSFRRHVLFSKNNAPMVQARSSVSVRKNAEKRKKINVCYEAKK